MLVDEVHREACASPPPLAATIHPSLVSTSSLTKAFGLSGLRCGWVVGSPEVATRVRRVRDAVDGSGPFPIEVASARAFERLPELTARTRAILGPNLARLRAFVASRSEIAWIEPEGGTTAFPRIALPEGAEAFAARLLRDLETAVVPGRFFQSPEHLRVSVGRSAETVERGLQAIAVALDSKP